MKYADNTRVDWRFNLDPNMQKICMVELMKVKVIAGDLLIKSIKNSTAQQRLIKCMSMSTVDDVIVS